MNEDLRKDSSLPLPCYERPLLFSLARFAGTVKGIDSVEAFERLDRRRAVDPTKSPLPIRKEKRELNVFRGYVRASGGGWKLSDKSWRAGTAQKSISKIAERAGMLGFVLYDLRRSSRGRSTRSC